MNPILPRDVALEQANVYRRHALHDRRDVVVTITTRYEGSGRARESVAFTSLDGRALPESDFRDVPEQAHPSWIDYFDQNEARPGSSVVVTIGPHEPVRFCVSMTCEPVSVPAGFEARVLEVAQHYRSAFGRTFGPREHLTISITATSESARHVDDVSGSMTLLDAEASNVELSEVLARPGARVNIYVGSHADGRDKVSYGVRMGPRPSSWTVIS